MTLELQGSGGLHAYKQFSCESVQLCNSSDEKTKAFVYGWLKKHSKTKPFDQFPSSAAISAMVDKLMIRLNDYSAIFLCKSYADMIRTWGIHCYCSVDSQAKTWKVISVEMLSSVYSTRMISHIKKIRHNMAWRKRPTSWVLLFLISSTWI